MAAWASHGESFLGLRYMARLAVVDVGRRSMRSILLDRMKPIREGSCLLWDLVQKRVRALFIISSLSHWSVDVAGCRRTMSRRRIPRIGLYLSLLLPRSLRVFRKVSWFAEDCMMSSRMADSRLELRGKSSAAVGIRGIPPGGAWIGGWGGGAG